MTHPRVVVESPRSACMAGRATPTMVTSSTITNWATQGRAMIMFTSCPPGVTLKRANEGNRYGPAPHRRLDASRRRPPGAGAGQHHLWAARRARGARRPGHARGPGDLRPPPRAGRRGHPAQPPGPALGPGPARGPGRRPAGPAGRRRLTRPGPSHGGGGGPGRVARRPAGPAGPGPGLELAGRRPADAGAPPRPRGRRAAHQRGRAGGAAPLRRLLLAVPGPLPGRGPALVLDGRLRHRGQEAPLRPAPPGTPGATVTLTVTIPGRSAWTIGESSDRKTD